MEEEIIHSDGNARTSLISSQFEVIKNKINNQQNLLENYLKKISAGGQISSNASSNVKGNSMLMTMRTSRNRSHLQSATTKRQSRVSTALTYKMRGTHMKGGQGQQTVDLISELEHYSPEIKIEENKHNSRNLSNRMAHRLRLSQNLTALNDQIKNPNFYLGGFRTAKADNFKGLQSSRNIDQIQNFKTQNHDTILETKSFYPKQRPLTSTKHQIRLLAPPPPLSGVRRDQNSNLNDTFSNSQDQNYLMSHNTEELSNAKGSTLSMILDQKIPHKKVRVQTANPKQPSFVDRQSNREIQNNYKLFSKNRQRMQLYSYEVRNKLRPVQNQFTAIRTHEFSEKQMQDYLNYMPEQLIHFSPEQKQWNKSMSKNIEKTKDLEDPYWKIVEFERRLMAVIKIQKVAQKFLKKKRALDQKHQMTVVQDMLNTALSSVYDLLIRSLNNPECLLSILKIQSFTRGYQQRKRYKKLLVIARKVVKLTEALTRASNEYWKGMFYFQYEKRYERLIRRLREERIKRCAKLLEDIRLSQGDPERQMGYLRREQSQKWLGARYDNLQDIARKSNTLQKLVIDDMKLQLNEKHKKLTRIYRLLLSTQKLNLRTALLKVNFDPFPADHFRLRRRRNSLPFTHVEKFLKEVKLNSEPVYQPPKPPRWQRPKYVEETDKQRKKVAVGLLKGQLEEALGEEDLESLTAGAMELHMVKKMTKTEKFNIVLRYNKLFQKAVYIFKRKVKKDLKTRSISPISLRRQKTSNSFVGLNSLRPGSKSSAHQLSKFKTISMKQRSNSKAGKSIHLFRKNPVIKVLDNTESIKTDESLDESSSSVSNRVASSTNSNQLRGLNSVLAIDDLANERLRTRRLEGFFYERDCCKNDKINDHTHHMKPVRIKRSGSQKPKENFTEEVKEIRRRQFFNFFADFYSKNPVIPDSDDEKSSTIKDLFKKYYTADSLMPKITVEIPHKCKFTGELRSCDCHSKVQMDVRNEYPRQLTSQKVLRFKEKITKDLKDQFLGQSLGILNRFDPDSQVTEFENTLELKIGSQEAYIQNKKKYSNRFSSLDKKVIDDQKKKELESIEAGKIRSSGFHEVFPEYMDFIGKYQKKRNVYESQVIQDENKNLQNQLQLQVVSRRLI